MPSSGSAFEMSEQLEQRSALLALSDAMAVSVQYGLGMRNQEIWERPLEMSPDAVRRFARS